MNKDVTSEIKNQTGIITINTADGLNVINRMMLSDIAETITAMDLNDAVKAIVIRGSDKAFSTGIDVNEFVENINAAVLEEMYENFEKIADVKNRSLPPSAVTLWESALNWRWPATLFSLPKAPASAIPTSASAPSPVLAPPNV